jgi:class 3 adenylate cyclase
MTIQRRINLSFVVIGVFFSLNLIVYFWSSHRQGISADNLQRATSRQLLFSDVQQEITSYQKQIALLGQTISDAGGRAGAGAGGGADPSEVSQFKSQLHNTADKIHELEKLADPDIRPEITRFASGFDALSASWTAFYQNFGVNTQAAIMELALRADPLTERIIQQTLPRLRAADRSRAELVTRRFFSESELSQRVNLGIYFVSTVIAMLIGWIVLRHIVNGLNKLKDGAAQIGNRKFDFRIDIGSRDEIGELAVAFNEMASNLSDAREELHRRHEELKIEKQHAETLMLNILPARAAKELREKGSVDPRYFEDATIMFTDFVGFTLSTEKLAAEDLVHMLHDYFTAFDRISRRYGLEKLKTIGDSYMCISGLPVRTASHPVDIVMAAFEMVQAVEERGRDSSLAGWRVRIGIHTGPVVAGVVGIDKFAFDIWGDSVNFSSRMESSGAPNRINMSDRTHARVKDFFECEHRGKVQTKDKREVDMYFANGILPSLLDPSGIVPPPRFVRRYKTYFEKEPPAFPACLLVPVQDANA